MYIQSTSFSSGSAWIAEAWSYFTRNPLGWVAVIVVGFFILIALSLIPFPLGEIALYIFSPVFVGGCMLGYVAYKEGGLFEFRHMFEGFKALYFKRLVMLSVFYTILTFAVVILVGIFAFVMFGGFEFFQEI